MLFVFFLFMFKMKQNYCIALQFYFLVSESEFSRNFTSNKSIHSVVRRGLRCQAQESWFSLMDWVSEGLLDRVGELSVNTEVDVIPFHFPQITMDLFIVKYVLSRIIKFN